MPSLAAALVRYLHEVLDLPQPQVESVVVTAVSEEVGEKMATIAERLRQEGRQEGAAIGRLENQRANLRALIARRLGALPAEVERRIDTAPMEELELWFDRGLDAKTLADVFGDA